MNRSSISTYRRAIVLLFLVIFLLCSLTFLYLHISSSYHQNASMSFQGNHLTCIQTKVVEHCQGSGDTPSITINFAGNRSDQGGPYWRPSDESIPLQGIFYDGYYTNDSRQHEDWMYINLTVSDDDGIDHVWLQWLNETTWTNYTYEFMNTGGDYWELNTGGLIPTRQGCKYSFDVLVNDTVGTVGLASWNKIGIGGTATRRYVQLNCNPVSIEYTPFYFFTAEYSAADKNKHDRLHHDQGPDGSLTDTGYLLSDEPDSRVHEIYCGYFIGYWFDESICVAADELSNMYYHFWWNCSEGLDTVGFTKTREYFQNFIAHQYYSTDANNAHSNMIYQSHEYYLDTHLMTLDIPSVFTDNSIYEYALYFDPPLVNPRVICNRSFSSFVLFNVPDNATLNTSYYDSDHDQLTDWTELYVTYTNPYQSDTDNDGATDYEEWYGALHGFENSDPNNYQDTTEYRRVTGDVNGDDQVDTKDIYLVQGWWGGDKPYRMKNPDLNGDGIIDIIDYYRLLASVGECSNNCPADLNNDYVIDTKDEYILRGYWGFETEQIHALDPDVNKDDQISIDDVFFILGHWTY